MRVLDIMAAIDTLEAARCMLRNAYTRPRNYRAELSLAAECQRVGALLLATVHEECPPIRLEREPAAPVTDDDARKAGV